MNKTTVFLALALLLPMGYVQAEDMNDLTVQALESNDPSSAISGMEVSQLDSSSVDTTQDSRDDSRDHASQSADDSKNDIEDSVDDSRHEVEDTLDDSRDEAKSAVDDSRDEIKQESVDSSSTDPQS